MDFYKPDYLVTDFDSALMTLGEQCNLTYNDSSSVVIFGMFNSLDFKSNMKGLSDNTKEFKCSKLISIDKGDYITTNENDVYMVNWMPYTDVNCKSMQVQLCNVTFDFERLQDAVIDYEGICSTPLSYVDIATSVKGFANRISMETFNSKTGEVGIEPSQVIAVNIQYNSDTADIHIGDEFSYFNNQFIVADIDYTQMHSSTQGYLTLYAKSLDGGRRVTD